MGLVLMNYDLCLLPATYLNFKEGQPDGESGENCVTMGAAGTWSDDSCDQTDKVWQYVCEKKGEKTLVAYNCFFCSLGQDITFLSFQFSTSFCGNHRKEACLCHCLCGVKLNSCSFLGTKNAKSSFSPSECPIGFDEYEGGCYKLETETATAYAAQAACEAEGSTLVTINDADKNAFIKTQFR